MAGRECVLCMESGWEEEDEEDKEERYKGGRTSMVSSLSSLYSLSSLLLWTPGGLESEGKLRKGGRGVDFRL